MQMEQKVGAGLSYRDPECNSTTARAQTLYIGPYKDDVPWIEEFDMPAAAKSERQHLYVRKFKPASK
jgi:hypothetical protein